MNVKCKYLLNSLRLANKKLFFNKNYNNESINQLKIYNSLTKRSEKLVLNNKNVLYWYICGPTVYDSAHIGHASCYINFDIIKRILINYFQVNVVNLMNITDIDDKIIKRSIKENRPFKEITKFYENEFFDDLNNLNIIRPSIVLRVTEYVPEIIKFIQKLVDSNHAYKTSLGNVYFNTKSFKKSFFHNIQNEPLEQDAKDKDKQNPNDFALWKTRKQNNEPYWPSPFGDGRPGWHIECSTLASLAFGTKLDFHSGGKDLLFPHHENELVQCCAHHGIDNWSTFWLHSGHVHLKDDIKMSKSLQNTISIGQLLKKYKSDEFRLFCLLSHYRNDKEYSDDKMTKAVIIYKKLNSFIEFTNAYCSGAMGDTYRIANLSESDVLKRLETSKQVVHDALCDDFNTSQSVNELLELVNYVNKLFVKPSDDSSSKIETNTDRFYGAIMAHVEYIVSTFNIFGVQLRDNNKQKNDIKIGQLIEPSIKFRNTIRSIAIKETNIDTKKQLLKACDELRNDLKVEKILLKDHKDKTTWSIE